MGAARSLILFIKTALVSVSPEQEAGDPRRCPAHQPADGIHRYVRGRFDDHFIVYMANDETMA